MLAQGKWYVFIFALLLLLAACSSSETSSDETETGEEITNESTSDEPKYGGTLNIATVSAPTLDIHRASSIYTHNIAGLVYSKLITYDTGPDVAYSDYNIVPDLAHDWDISEDGTVYTFYLHENAKWHDKPPVNGRNVTSEDVLATFERIQTLPGHQAYMLEPIEKMEALDDHTVQFTLKEPFAPFLANMANHFMWIIPKEAVDEVDGFSLETDAIGSGPFVLDKWDRDVETLFSKNENYFIEGLPYLDKLHYRIIPDSDTRLAAFRTGQVETTGDVSPEQLRNLLSAEPDLPYDQNLFATQAQLYLNQTREPFDDLRVRRAISLAIDRQSAVDQLFGAGEISGPVNPSLGDWALPLEEREELQPYDVEQAKALLAEAGYPDGFSTTLMVTDAYGNTIVRMAQWIVEDLKEIGIDVELEVLEYATYYTQRWPNLEYNMGFGYQTFLQEPDEWLYGQYHSRGAKNWYGINIPEVDRMMEEQRVIMDPEERLEKVHEIQRYVIENVSNPIGLTTHITAAPYRPYLKGWYPHSSYGSLHMKEVWLDK